MAREPYNMTQEQIDNIAQRLHSYEADDYTLKWGKQTSKYRNSMRKSVRNMLSALEQDGFKLAGRSPAPAAGIEDPLKKAVAAFNALSPEQQAEMMEEQRQSWVRGNIGLSRDERGMTSPVMPRPAPAATDTGLVTVAKVDSRLGDMSRLLIIDRPLSIGTEVCLRSQAEELLAAKDKQIALAETSMLEMHQDLNKLEAELAAERAEKEIAERNRDAARDNFLTMQKSAAKLLERAEKAEADNARQAARIKELEGHIYVPGSWHCPKCKFTLQQMVMSAQDCSVAPQEKPGEPCPNCQSPLWRVTWKQDAMEMSDRVEEQMNATKALEAKLEAAENGVRYALANLRMNKSDEAFLADVLGGKTS